MSRKHPMLDELEFRLQHFPRSGTPPQTIAKHLYGGIAAALGGRLGQEEVAQALQKALLEYIDQLRETHNARGPCENQNCIFNPNGAEIHKILERSQADAHR